MEDLQTDLISRIIFRAIDETSAVLKGIAVQMEAVEASVARVDAEYGAAIMQLEQYEVRVAGVSKSMAAVSTPQVPQMAVVGNSEAAERQAKALAAADAAVTAESVKAGNAAEKSAGQIRKQGDAARTTEGSIRKAASALLLIGGILVGAGVASGVMATRFQSDMELVKTQAHASQVEVDRMGQAVLKLAPEVGTGPDVLATGLYHIESAGFRGAQALRILRAAAEGAKVGHANLESVTQALIAVTASHIKGVRSEIDAMGILNGIVGAGDMRMQQLADAMSTGVVESAKTFGLSIRDVGAALATLGDNLIQGSEAGTRLRMTLALMAAPSDKAAKVLETIGLKATSLANDMRKPQGLLVALQDLKTHLEDSGKTASQQADILSHAFGGGRSSAVLLTLLDQMDRLKKKYGDVADGARKFGQDWAATQKQAKQQWDDLTASAEVMAIQVGTAVVPAFKSLVAQMLPSVKAGTDWARTHQQAVVVAIALGGLLLSLGLAMKAYALVADLAKAASVAWTAAQWLLNAALDANPIGLVVIAVAALAAGFIYAYTHSETFRQIVQRVLAALKDLAGFIETKVVGTFKLLVDIAGRVGHELDGLAHMLGINKGDFLALVPVIGPVILAFEHVGQIVQTVGGWISWLSGIIGRFLSALASAASNVPLLGKIFGALIDPIKEAAQAFEALGAKIDSYAQSGTKSDAVTQHMMDKQRQLQASLDATSVATGRAAATTDAVGAKHKSVTDRMVTEAGKVESAWDRIGKKIAAVGLALAAATLSGAHAEGAAASQQIGRQLQTTVHVHAPSVTVAGQTANQQISYQNFRDQGAAQAQATGNNAQVLSNIGAGGGVAGLDKSIASFAASVDKLPPSLQGAMSGVIQQYRQQIDALEKQAAAAVRSEDQRHIAALQAIQKAHEAAINAAQKQANQQLAALNAQHQAALRAHSTSVQQSLQQHTQRLNQTVAQHVQAIRNDATAHEQKLKAIHDAYLAKLDSIHGKNAAERRAAAEASYQKQVAAANTSYQKQIQAQERAIESAKKAYDDYLASLKTGNAAYIAQQKAAYERHVQGIQSALNNHVDKANSAAATAQSKEDALHTKHVAAIKAAFEGHVQGLKQALKNASTPTALVNSLSSQLQKNYDDALNKVTLDILEHGKASKKDIAAVEEAAAAQKKLTAAEWDAAFVTADAATKAQMLSQRFQDLISAANTRSQIQQSEESGQLQILSDKATAQLDELKSVESAIQSQTAVLQAQAAVDQAQGNAQLAALKDQNAIIQAQGALASAKTDADRKVAQDQLRIAQETMAMDQSQAHWDQVIAQDNLVIAQVQQQAAAEAATWTQRIDQIKIQLSQAQLVLTKAQNQLSLDQLVVQTQIADALGAVNDYQSMIQNDLSAIGDAQQQVASLTAQMQEAQQQAAAAAQAWAIKVAQDQQQLAEDAAAKVKDSIDYQTKIQTDENQLTQDQQAQQLAATQASLTQTSQAASTSQDQNQTIIDKLQQQLDEARQQAADKEARDGEMIAHLEQLVEDSRSAVSARPSTAAKTTNGYYNNLSGQRASTVTPR